jgi:hypothetical protein
MREAGAIYGIQLQWVAEQIVIFKLRFDPLDISAVEKKCRVEQDRNSRERNWF